MPGAGVTEGAEDEDEAEATAAAAAATAGLEAGRGGGGLVLFSGDESGTLLVVLPMLMFGGVSLICPIICVILMRTNGPMVDGASRDTEIRNE